jgi:dTDP-4-dehydrorhamnose reductase
MKKILLTGGSGQLALSFLTIQQAFPEFEIISFSRNKLDITSSDKLKNTIDLIQPDFVINCAAYTAVDLAETEIEQAFAINRNGTEVIGKTCAQYNIPVIHFSSDYVYHNSHNRPLKETDPTLPKGIYAQSKLEGEQKLLEYQPKSIIIRTSWVYSNHGKNFFHTILKLSTQKKELRIVADQIGSPTYAPELAKQVLQILNGKIAFGVFNYSPEGVCSWYDFALEILTLSNLKANVIPISTEEFNAPAKRPYYSVLDKTKIKTTFDLTIPHWKTGLIESIKNHLSLDSF